MEIGISEAKTKLSDLLDMAEKGEEVVITRRGRPVARLVPVEDEARCACIDKAVLRLRALREELRSRGVRVTAEEIKEWIEEGRL